MKEKREKCWGGVVKRQGNERRVPGTRERKREEREPELCVEERERGEGDKRKEMHGKREKLKRVKEEKDKKEQRGLRGG